ncbi:SusD/RagB family nutrient-binding outer membrane lipoprotein [Spongiimicrobium sp. 3-5]|uniref:SusD/RagB family nutrient-binding outer membrane lipoprotein n=1 Tax=Spongiimicrobium sp. 3-5 TaxID=3332596 RepID=UPI0039818D67
MKFKDIYIAFLLIFSLASCEKLVDDINENDPNTISNVNGRDLFIGIQLADISAQSAYLDWVSGIWCGYYVGSGRFEPIQNYQFADVNSNTPWGNIYQGVVKQVRELRSGIELSNKDFFFGASKVVEAHALGTAANLFGDVPFTEAGNDEISSPVYDAQASVYANLQTLLDEAITDLTASGTTGGIVEDLFYGGDTNKWIAAAYTLKARLYMDVGDYGSALSAAQQGINSADATMAYSPPAVVGTGDINLLNSLATSATGVDLAVDGSFLIGLLGTDATSRNNGKTDEVDRYAFYYDGTEINLNGIAKDDAPMKQISLEENLLLWAEALLRTGGSNFGMALQKLNEHRTNLRNGVYFAVTTGVYDDYVETDFDAGGIENVSGTISREDALLREIIEERYATFFNQVLGFNDLRRTKKDNPAIQVPVPFNAGAVHPERFLYPFTERNTNENTPAIEDIFTKTEINQ